MASETHMRPCGKHFRSVCVVISALIAVPGVYWTAVQGYTGAAVLYTVCMHRRRRRTGNCWTDVTVRTEFLSTDLWRKNFARSCRNCLKRRACCRRRRKMSGLLICGMDQVHSDSFEHIKEDNMKVVILAGGFGTRISEESHLKPKPMIEIGEKPILWHIMKLYSHYGFNDFVICAGYKQHVIKEFFADYFLHTSDITFDLQTNSMEVHDNFAEPWKVTVVDTGLNTMTGGRVKRIRKFVGDEPFMLTYGDGVSNVDIGKLVEYHKSHGKYCTMTATNIGQRFGVLEIENDNRISGFREKNDSDGSMINVGFMVCEPQVFDYIEGDSTVLEKAPLENLAKDGQLVAYRHEGFWQCMDTQREKQKLEELWASGRAPWKVWEE